MAFDPRIAFRVHMDSFILHISWRVVQNRYPITKTLADRVARHRGVHGKVEADYMISQPGPAVKSHTLMSGIIEDKKQG